MTAVLVMPQAHIDRDPGTWHKHRQAGLTGSEIGTALGLSSWRGPYSLYHAKIDGEDIDEKPVMTRGKRLEPDVVEGYTARYPWVQVLPGGLYAKAGAPWMLATLDKVGFDTAVNGGQPICSWDGPEGVPAGMEDATFPIELKTSATREGYGDDGSGVIPLAYRAQALWQMDVWGADEVHIPVLFMQEWRVRTYHLSRDETTQRDIDVMIAEGQRFLNRIADRDEPDIDWLPSTTETLRKLHPDLADREVNVGRGLAKRYEAARANLRRAEQRYKLITNLLRAEMGDAARAVAPGPGGDLLTVCSRSIGDTLVQSFKRHDDKLNPGKWGKDLGGSK